MTNRISGGYGAPTPGSPAAQKLARKQRDAARRHVENPEMERLLRWRNTDDPRYDQLDAHTKMVLGFYAADKKAYEIEEREQS